MVRKAAMLLAFLATVSATACGTEAPTPTESAEVPPMCKTLTSFGNGAQCSAADATLQACGSAPRRTCASGWLCFDSAVLVDCTCAMDSDCAGRTAYINAGRIATGKAPLSSQCASGRCVGRP